MRKRIKILCLVGARPNFIKIAPLIEEMKKYRQIKPILVHTGQHYDFEMSQVFFQELEIPKPDYNLGVGSGSHAWQTAKIMEKLEPVFLKERPDLVVVVGDVNSTLAGALVAAKLHIPVAHIEAGARSYDQRIPEEINRALTDHISDFLFIASYLDKKNLRREGIEQKKIFLVGNIMTDTLLKYKKRASDRFRLKNKNYIVLTLHRAENVDNKKKLQEILKAIKILAQKIPIVFPIHPRTKKMIRLFGLKKYLKGLVNLILIPPISYLEMIALVKNAKLVLTDSGGLQHETTVLGVPCLTLKKTTEWPITVKMGTNLVVGNSKDKIVKEALKIIAGKNKKGRCPKLWDGKTAKRIVRILENKMFKSSN